MGIGPDVAGLHSQGHLCLMTHQPGLSCRQNARFYPGTGAGTVVQTAWGSPMSAGSRSLCHAPEKEREMPSGSMEKGHSPLEEHPRTDTRTDPWQEPSDEPRDSPSVPSAGGLSWEGSQGLGIDAPSFLRGATEGSLGRHPELLGCYLSSLLSLLETIGPFLMKTFIKMTREDRNHVN